MKNITVTRFVNPEELFSCPDVPTMGDLVISGLKSAASCPMPDEGLTVRIDITAYVPEKRKQRKQVIYTEDPLGIWVRDENTWRYDPYRLPGKRHYTRVETEVPEE